jgi:hypothetical protein
MSDKIRCFFIRALETVDVGTHKVHVYTSDDGRLYHLGHTNVLALDDGRRIEAAPVGAMWDCDWMHGCHEPTGLQYDRNPDGIVLCVRCPGGDWVVDGPSRSGGSWNRTGAIPNVTVTPSIVQGGLYHGWLRDGYLEEC